MIPVGAKAFQSSTKSFEIKFIYEKVVLYVSVPNVVPDIQGKNKKINETQRN